MLCLSKTYFNLTCTCIKARLSIPSVTFLYLQLPSDRVESDTLKFRKVAKSSILCVHRVSSYKEKPTIHITTQPYVTVVASTCVVVNSLKPYNFVKLIAIYMK